LPLTLDDLATRIRRARRCQIGGNPGLRGCCPAHSDERPSFYAWEGPDGWLHLRCPKCSEAELSAALGITDFDRKLRPNPDPEPETRYVYRDEMGQNLLCKVRRRIPGGGKVFRVEGWKDGHWVQGISHLGDERHTLYNLAAVREAIRQRRPVYLNEGEKACEAMAARGMVGTCQPFGADTHPSGRWRPRHSEFLRGADVIIVADRDDVGEAYAKYIARQLLKVAHSVRVVQSRTQNEKDDAYDHLSKGYGEDDWIERIDLTPAHGLRTVRFHPETFRPAEVAFILQPYFPKGKCVLLDADGGTGKTALMVATAACFSHGSTPICGTPRPPLRTLYLHKGEDQNEELGSVFLANGGDLRQIEFYEGPLTLDDTGVLRLEEAIFDGGFELVVFDALFYFLYGVVEDAGVALEALPVMERLNRLAKRTRATIVNIRHTTKGTIGKSAAELGMGSVQFRNSHRGQLVARRHPTRPDLVVVTDEKGSLLTPRGPHFCYRREGLEVQFVHGVANPFEEEVVSRQPKLDTAIAFLREQLTGRSVTSGHLLEQAKKHGIGERTLKKARAVLGVQAVRNGDTWLLHLSDI